MCNETDLQLIDSLLLSPGRTSREVTNIQYRACSFQQPAYINYRIQDKKFYYLSSSVFVGYYNDSSLTPFSRAGKAVKAMAQKPHEINWYINLETCIQGI